MKGEMGWSGTPFLQKVTRTMHRASNDALISTVVDLQAGMLCFVLEDMESLRVFNVEDEATAHMSLSPEVQRRVQHAQDRSVPELWVVHGHGEELIGGVEALNEELTSRKLFERLDSAGVKYLSPDVDDYW